MATVACHKQIGVGHIGGLMAHHLRRALPSAHITFLSRGGSRFMKMNETDRRVQLKVQRSDGRLERSDNFHVEMNWDRERIDDPINSLLVCLKAHQTFNAIYKLRDRLSPSSVITLLQNGMGVYQQLCADIWPNPQTRPFFILGSTTHGARSMGTGERTQIAHTSALGKGDIVWGAAPDPREEVNIETWLWKGRKASQDPFLAPGPRPSLPLAPPPEAPTDLAPLHNTLTALLSVVDLAPRLVSWSHIQHILLMKLALNSIINPLTAILGAGALPNGALITSGPARRAMMRLAREVSEVITAHLNSRDPDGRAPPDVLQHYGRNALFRRALALCKNTQSNLSSMAVDVSNGVATEIGFINGHISALGRQYGVPTPANDLLSDMVKYTAEISGLWTPGSRQTTPAVLRRRNSIAHRGFYHAERWSPPQARSPSEGKLAHIQTRQTAQYEKVQERAAYLASRRPHRRWYSTPSRASNVQHTPPAAGLALNMSDLIASAPRQMRYWDLEGDHLVEAPKALGPPESLTQKFKAAADTANEVAKTTVDLSKGGLGSALDALIAASPRQERTWTVQTEEWQGLMRKTAKQVQKKAVETVAKTASSLDAAISAGTAAIPRLPRKAASAPASNGLAQLASWRTELDSLITAAPRQERTWDTAGGTLVPLPNDGQPSLLASMVGKGYTGQQLARGGLGGVMDSMIAASPRQERTYDWKPTQTRVGGRVGRFNTSKSSGS